MITFDLRTIIPIDMTIEILVPPHREILSKFYQIKPKSDCIYQFPTDLDLNGRPFGSKLIGKW